MLRYGWLGIFLALAGVSWRMLRDDAADDGRIQVRVRFDSSHAAATVSNLTVIVGDDKYSWPGQAAGKTTSVTMQAAADSEREVTLLYDWGGERKVWQGPKLGFGAQAYRMFVRIDGNGRADGRWCAQPCRLDEAAVR